MIQISQANDLVHVVHGDRSDSFTLAELARVRVTEIAGALACDRNIALLDLSRVGGQIQLEQEDATDGVLLRPVGDAVPDILFLLRNLEACPRLQRVLGA
jgi:hypothetical protein